MSKEDNLFNICNHLWVLPSWHTHGLPVRTVIDLFLLLRIWANVPITPLQLVKIGILFMLSFLDDYSYTPEILEKKIPMPRTWGVMIFTKK